MKVPAVHRLALAALAVTALANAGFGSCSGDSSSNTYNPPGPFGGFDAADAGAGGSSGGSSDLGFSSGYDAAFQGDQVVLTSPTPLQSNVKLDASFNFAATLVSGTPQDLEAYITITPRNGVNALNGAFSWKQTGPVSWSISFIPTGLTDKTDYLVVVTSPTTGAELLRTGVSTGSHPRVTNVSLTSVDAATQVYFTITFSEPMTASSLASAVSATTGMTGALTAHSGTLAAVGSKDGTTFQYTLDNGKGLPLPLTLHVASSATAVAGGALDAASWDSPTVDASNNFFVDFYGVSLDDLPGTTVLPWSPTIN
jgi:hypothetical protein